MRRIVCACVVVGLTATMAWAEWLVDFQTNYASKGIDVAVVEAMKEGIAPDAIVENGLALQGLNPQNLVKALYCAGARGQDINAAAERYAINPAIVQAGFKKSVEECGDRIADTQAFTPAAAPAPAFAGLPSAASGGTFASPSTF